MKLNRIKAVLSEKGISQTWLAKRLDKSFSMVNAYACNRIQPNLDTLQLIAEILQVDLKYLITDKRIGEMKQFSEAKLCGFPVLVEEQKVVSGWQNN